MTKTVRSLITAVAVPACSGSAVGTATPATDAAAPSPTATTPDPSDPIADAGVDASKTDASASDAAPCSTLPNTAPVVLGEAASSGTPPPPAGGTIALGTYHLTAETVYSSPALEGPTKLTLRVSTGTIETAFNDSPTTKPTKSDVARYTYTTASKAIDGKLVCGSAVLFKGGPPLSYTASGGTLFVYVGGAVLTFAKQ